MRTPSVEFRPETWAERFLTHSCVERQPNTFVLGCFERRRVTVGAQQVRAVNLIEALLRRQVLDSSLVVVGAGVAGLTAAAYAGYRGVPEIHVFESKSQPLALFAESNRLLHPRLYEWPFDAEWAKPDVDLPLMNWETGSARKIASELRDQWNSWRNLYSIEEHLERRLVRNENRLILDGATRAEQKLLEEANAVILAVGFGAEQRPQGLDSPGYWQRDDFDTASGSFLICGNGDGALTDLFRARVDEFRQQELEHFLMVEPDSVEELTEECLEIEELYVQALKCGDREKREILLNDRAESYGELVTPAMVEFFADRLREDTSVVLSVRAHGRRRSVEEGGAQTAPFLSDHCFPLNRLFAEALLRAEWRTGSSRLVIRSAAPSEELPPDAHRFDRVAFRGGTRPAIDPLLRPGDANRLRSVITDPETGDVTRFPLWDQARISPGALVCSLPQADRGPRIVAEIYGRAGRLTVFTDLVDSVVQTKICDALREESPVRPVELLRGTLRLLVLLSDRLQMIDSQVFDGRLFLEWMKELSGPESWRELELFRSALEIRSRSGDYLAYREFFLSGRGRARRFEPSSFPGPARRAFLRWRERQTERAWSGLNDLLDAFSNDHPDHAEAVGRVREAWRKLVESAPFSVERWGAGWSLDQQFEDPGLFHARRTEFGKQLVEQVWRARAKRSLAWNILRRAKVESRARPDEILEVRSWYNRAYNRAAARQHGATVFVSLYGGCMPIDAEPATLGSRVINVAGLGKLHAEEFIEIVESHEDELSRLRRTGDIGLKLDLLQSFAESSPNVRPVLVGSEVEPAVRRAIHALSFVQIEQKWIGSRELGPGKSDTVVEQAFSAPEELNHQTEVLAR